MNVSPGDCGDTCGYRGDSRSWAPPLSGCIKSVHACHLLFPASAGWRALDLLVTATRCRLWRYKVFFRRRVCPEVRRKHPRKLNLWTVFRRNSKLGFIWLKFQPSGESQLCNAWMKLTWMLFASAWHSVDATKETNRMGRLINHSKNGNCQTKLHDINDVPHLILVASRDIDEGEELLYDYGDRSKASIAAYPWLKHWEVTHVLLVQNVEPQEGTCHHLESVCLGRRHLLLFICVYETFWLFCCTFLLYILYFLQTNSFYSMQVVVMHFYTAFFLISCSIISNTCIYGLRAFGIRNNHEMQKSRGPF